LSTPTSPRRGGAFVVLAITLLTGLAGGALCCLLALAIKQEPIWLMLPMAVVIGAFVRWQDYRGLRGALVAAAAMLLCVLYTQYIYAAVRMADMLGFPLRDTLFKLDWRLAWQIVRSNSGIVEAAILVFAPAIAAAVTARTARA
jgi:hypothetical protein